MTRQRPAAGPCPQQQLRKKIGLIFQTPPARSSTGRCPDQIRAEQEHRGQISPTYQEATVRTDLPAICSAALLHGSSLQKKGLSPFLSCIYNGIYQVLLAPSAATNLLSVIVTGIAQLCSALRLLALSLQVHRAPPHVPCKHRHRLSRAASPLPPAWCRVEPSPGASLPTPQLSHGGHSQCQTQLTRT